MCDDEDHPNAIVASFLYFIHDNLSSLFKTIFTRSMLNRQLIASHSGSVWDVLQGQKTRYNTMPDSRHVVKRDWKAVDYASSDRIPSLALSVEASLSEIEPGPVRRRLTAENRHKRKNRPGAAQPDTDGALQQTVARRTTLRVAKKTETDYSTYHLTKKMLRYCKCNVFFGSRPALTYKVLRRHHPLKLLHSAASNPRRSE